MPMTVSMHRSNDNCDDDDVRWRQWRWYRVDFLLQMVGWLLGFYDSTRDKDDRTVGVGHSRRYCNTGYDQSQGRRPSTLKCIGPISKGDIEPNHPSEINPNSDSRKLSDGRSRQFVQYRVDQSQGQRPRSLLLQMCASIVQHLFLMCFIWVFNYPNNGNAFRSKCPDAAWSYYI